MWKMWLRVFAKSFDPCQPTRSAQADMGRNFSLFLNFLHVNMIQPVAWQNGFYGSITRWGLAWYNAWQRWNKPFFLPKHGSYELLQVNNAPCVIQNCTIFWAFFRSWKEVFRKHCEKGRSTSVFQTTYRKKGFRKHWWSSFSFSRNVFPNHISVFVLIFCRMQMIPVWTSLKIFRSVKILPFTE